MKNWEKYEKEIKALGINNFSVSKDGEVDECVNKRCSECRFGEEGKCFENIVDWLYEDAEDINERD